MHRAYSVVEYAVLALYRAAQSPRIARRKTEDAKTYAIVCKPLADHKSSAAHAIAYPVGLCRVGYPPRPYIRIPNA
eukprot:5199154-Lingulodinium_polyedra.AAC.3